MRRRKEPFMKKEDWFGLLFFGALGLIAVNEISKAKWCGQYCQSVLSDARGTLVRDMITGLIRWV